MTRVLQLFLLALPSLLGEQEFFTLAEKAIRDGDYAVALEKLKSIRCGPTDGLACPARVSAMQGAARLMSGKYTEAEAAFNTGLGLYRQLKDRAHIVDLLNNLGSVHFYRGEYAEAHVDYRAAEAELKGAEGQAWFASASHLTAVNMATLYQRLGRYYQALEIYQSLGKVPVGLSASERAQLLSNLAVLNRRLGDPWKARSLLEQSLALLEADQNRDAWLGVVKNLGIVLALDLGDLHAAQRLFRQALLEAERIGNPREAMQARLYLAETLMRLGKNDEALRYWQNTLADSRSLQTAEDEWRSRYGIARVERRRRQNAEAEGTLRSCMRLIEQVHSGIGAPTLKTEFLSDKQEVYEEMLALLAERAATAEAFDVMERARALVLREALPDRSTNVTLAQLQTRLRSDEAALLYRVGRTQSFLLWATRGDAGIRTLPVNEAAFIQKLSKIRENINGAQEAKSFLSSALLDSAPPLGHSTLRRLWIVPEGVLSLLPFELLPLHGKLLVERFETAYLPAAGFLRSASPLRRTVKWPWQREMVAYAEPDLRSAQLLPGDERWHALPDSAGEVATIARILPGNVDLYRGAQISPSDLLEHARQAPFLHLATHAAGDLETGQRSRLLIGPSYLYARQLTPGKLTGVQIAVLSACDTEAGPISRGEGVQSLARGFLLAGARTTIASLWKVDDAATRLLMVDFYRRLSSGEEISTALRGTKLSFLRSNSTLRLPQYWAAFVSQGAADEAAPRWISWTWLFALTAAVMSAIAIVVWAISRKRAER